jgi:16S rRNA (guanine(966)-N(2))-methyltransferase RsmD
VARPAKHPAHANRVRIVGGTFRSRLIHFADAPGLRPTPDRVRETIFNWLGQDLAGMRCLDAFAGSGALGFEAASRHAARVVMLEKDRTVAAALAENRAHLSAGQVEIIQADALAWMAQCQEAFDLIFLDPPFGSSLMQEALPRAVRLLAADGWLYVEQATPILPPEGFIMHREGTAGQSRFALLKRA